jgi:muramoyltetrapeptide carboxypeptidase
MYVTSQGIKLFWLKNLTIFSERRRDNLWANFMNIIYPEPLKPGDTIGLVTPSSPMMSGRLEAGTAYLEKKGFKVQVGQHVHDNARFLAGKDSDRAQDIMRFFKDSKIKAIMATGGGYGSQRILPLLDYDLIRANPKWLTGFSDTTALQLGLLRKAGIASCTGFVFNNLDDGPLEPLIEKTLMACLSNEPYEINEGDLIHSGIVQGPLIGGNLESITALIGTPYQPVFNHAILFIEEVGTEPYIIDMKLSQLELAGVFEQVSGVIWGQFKNCTANYFPTRDGTIDEVITEWSARFKKPCIKNFPYGHMNRRCVLPIGKEVTLNADTCTLLIP